MLGDYEPRWHPISGPWDLESKPPLAAIEPRWDGSYYLPSTMPVTESPVLKPVWEANYGF